MFKPRGGGDDEDYEDEPMETSVRSKRAGKALVRFACVCDYL